MVTRWMMDRWLGGDTERMIPTWMAVLVYIVQAGDGEEDDDGADEDD